MNDLVAEYQQYQDATISVSFFAIITLPFSANILVNRMARTRLTRRSSQLRRLKSLLYFKIRLRVFEFGADGSGEWQFFLRFVGI